MYGVWLVRDLLSGDGQSVAYKLCLEAQAILFLDPFVRGHIPTRSSFIKSKTFYSFYINIALFTVLAG